MKSPEIGGPGGIRTLDLSDANRTLSQLSYRPKYNCIMNHCNAIYYIAFGKQSQDCDARFLRLNKNCENGRNRRGKMWKT